jgi:hypothetical protein
MPFLFAVTLAAFAYFQEAPPAPRREPARTEKKLDQAGVKSARPSCTREPLRCTR